MANLSRLDGKSVALVLNQFGRKVVWQGIGSYQIDGYLGNVLRIRVGESHAHCGSHVADCGAEFLIQESHWRGRIVDGLTYGCDYVAGMTPPDAK